MKVKVTSKTWDIPEETKEKAREYMTKHGKPMGTPEELAEGKKKEVVSEHECSKIVIQNARAMCKTGDKSYVVISTEDTKIEISE